ncbi:hypothetical protein ABIF93_011584 [Bradyrhizobium japonicum]
MQSSARSVISAVGRGAELLTDVDYHLAETDAEKEQIYNLRYRAYLREGAVRESAEARVTDRYDELPNAWTFGVYLRGQLCSSVRISVLTSEWRESTSADVFPDILLPRLDRGEVMIDPTRFVADPDQVKRVPELPYLTTRLAYMACEHFNADLGLAIVRPEHQRLLPSGFPARDDRRAPPGAGSYQAVRTDGGGFPDLPEEGVRALSDHALHRLRAADAVRARWAARDPAAVVTGAGSRSRLIACRHRLEPPRAVRPGLRSSPSSFEPKIPAKTCTFAGCCRLLHPRATFRTH